MRDASAYFDGDGNLHLAYLATEILRIAQTVTIDGVDVVIENIPEDGRSDLETSIISGTSLTAPPKLQISSFQGITGDRRTRMMAGWARARLRA